MITSASSKTLRKPGDTRFKTVPEAAVAVFKNGGHLFHGYLPSIGQGCVVDDGAAADGIVHFDREFPENTLDEQFVQYDFPAVVTEIEQGSGAGQGGPEPGAVIPSQGRIQNVFDPSLQSRKIEGVLGGKIDEIASDGRL